MFRGCPPNPPPPCRVLIFIGYFTLDTLEKINQAFLARNEDFKEMFEIHTISIPSMVASSEQTSVSEDNRINELIDRAAVVIIANDTRPSPASLEQDQELAEAVGLLFEETPIIWVCDPRQPVPDTRVKGLTFLEEYKNFRVFIKPVTDTPHDFTSLMAEIIRAIEGTWLH